MTASHPLRPFLIIFLTISDNDWWSTEGLDGSGSMWEVCWNFFSYFLRIWLSNTVHLQYRFRSASPPRLHTTLRYDRYFLPVRLCYLWFYLFIFIFVDLTKEIGTIYVFSQQPAGNKDTVLLLYFWPTSNVVFPLFGLGVWLVCPLQMCCYAHQAIIYIKQVKMTGFKDFYLLIDHFHSLAKSINVKFPVLSPMDTARQVFFLFPVFIIRYAS